MSGGQRQRVAIARTLVREADVVLADEPTAALDQATGLAVMELMKRLNRERGVTFVFSTHDPVILGAADRVVRLRDGRVLG
jgi:putative ABC transport system ATP-binding protein